MDNFESLFFSELSELDDVKVYCDRGSDVIDLDNMPRENELLVSRMLTKGTLSNKFANLTSRLTTMLAFRSKMRFDLERDFRVKPYQVYTHSKGRSGRKQLYIRFDAIPTDRMISTLHWGASIGLGFKLHLDDKISPECVADFNEFWMIVWDEPELFEMAFHETGGYAEPSDGPVNAQKALDAIPTIQQPWLFYGKRMTMEEIRKLGTLEDFVDECFRIFDRICKAGFYD